MSQLVGFGRMLASTISFHLAAAMLVLLIVMGISGFANDSLADQESESNAVSGNVGDDEGFFIQSPDERFKLIIGGYLQGLFEYEAQRSPSSRISIAPFRPLGVSLRTAA